jgi:hypothetical protein
MASRKAARQNDSATPMMPLKYRRGYSRESLGRYSENSLHSTYFGRYGGGKCIKEMF